MLVMFAFGALGLGAFGFGALGLGAFGLPTTEFGALGFGAFGLARSGLGAFGFGAFGFVENSRVRGTGRINLYGPDVAAERPVRIDEF